MLRIDFAGSFESDSEEKKFLKKVDGFERIHYHGIIEGSDKRIFRSSSYFLLLIILIMKDNLCLY